MTLLRTLFLIALVAGVSLALAWFANAPGSVSVDWHGWRIETSLLFLIAADGD